MASSAEVQGATGALAGNVYITGRRAMPPCAVEGTPRIQILDAKGQALPVEQVEGPATGRTAGPVVLGSPDQPNPAAVVIVWRNFCQTPAPPAPYSLRITLPDGGVLPLNPPLAALGPQGQAVDPGVPRCDAPSSPSTLSVGPFQLFAPGKP